MTDTDDSSPETARPSRLAAYLGGLQPTTQVAVMREVEMSELRGESLGASFKTVMTELRRGIRKSGLTAQRVANPSVLFYMPVEPFVLDEIPEEAVVATVTRMSLNPIWAWICRDLMPADAKSYIAIAREALENDDQASALAAATVFQDKFVEACRSALARKDVATERKLAAYGGPRTVGADLRSVLAMLRRRDALKDFAKALPSKLDVGDAAIRAQLAALIAPMQGPDEAMLTHAVAIVMSKLTDPWQIVALAAGDGKTRDAIAELALGRARTVADALRTAKWSLDQTGHVRARISAMRSAIELLRAELRPQSGSPEERRCALIVGLIDRCERKIQLTMSTMGTLAPVPSRVASARAS
jgi:hypothetical protein